MEEKELLAEIQEEVKEEIQEMKAEVAEMKEEIKENIETVQENEEESHEGFTVGLALVDSLPVIFFIGSTAIIASGLGSPIFIIGAVLSALAGIGKVLWKLFLGLGLGDIKFLNKMFVPFQASGFLIMIAGVVVAAIKKTINWGSVGKSIISFPAILCFLAGIGGMGFMGYYRKKYDKETFNTDAKKNWIAQITNGVAQGMIFLGVLFSKLH